MVSHGLDTAVNVRARPILAPFGGGGITRVCRSSCREHAPTRARRCACARASCALLRARFRSAVVSSLAIRWVRAFATTPQRGPVTRGTRRVANYLAPARALLAVRLLMSGASQREASDVAGVNRSAVKRIQSALEAGQLAHVVQGLSKRRIMTVCRLPWSRNRSREVTHEELVIALVKRAAVDVASEVNNHE